MMKRKVLILSLLAALLVALVGVAMAEADPIVCSMELNPDKLTGPGTVNVTITISNSGDTDMKDPVVLYDPAAQIVADFGTNGAALLKAGESITWTGAYEVSERMLKNGAVVYYVKYTLYKDSGEAVDQSQPIRQKIELRTAEADIDVKRTISPTIAREGQEVIVRYDISNTGTVDLTDVTIQENKDIHKEKQTIPVLKPGQTAEIRYPVTMGKKDLTSGAKITYKAETLKKAKTYTVENQKIAYGEPKLEAKLSSSAKGVTVNGTITLTLELKNTGSVDYGDMRVTDPTLGDVFTNQELKAGKTLKLEKVITVPATADYQFTVTATDATGTETSVATDAVTVTAVAPEDALHLTVSAVADRTEVFEQPGHVRFTVEVFNDSQVEAKNVQVSHGDTKIYTFESIPAGEKRSLSRDTALSMAGKYRFTVTAEDPLETSSTFQSNEIQVAFSVPTPAPATPTPAPDPTPEPTFSPATVPPITDSSVGRVPKTIQNVLLAVSIVSGVLLAASCVLLAIATKRRADQKKASEAAIDQLERAKRRDYVTPAEEEEAPEPAEEEEPVINSTALDEDLTEEDFELPHMKYARSAAQPVEQQDGDDYSAMESSYYDEEMTSGQDGYDEQENPPEEDYDRMAYGDAQEEEAYSDGEQEQPYEAGYDYAEDYDSAAFDESYEGWQDGPEPEEEAAQGADDSIFRRPAGDETEKRRSRRSRSRDTDV
ncbi:MAG: hypothetical protein MRZ54_08465 [Clostridiales bacterium]|nr:hypothetical protein [Clostridiales bacterium]